MNVSIHIRTLKDNISFISLQRDGFNIECIRGSDSKNQIFICFENITHLPTLVSSSMDKNSYLSKMPLVNCPENNSRGVLQHEL